MKPFKHVALIGLGLIASSICHAQRRVDPSVRITGYARSKETRDIAREIKLCEVFDTLEDAVGDADLIILCVPIGAMSAVTREIAPFLKKGAVISDVGSVKAEVIEAIHPHLNESVTLVPAHPIAGSELSGPRAGYTKLFDNRWTVLTPLEGTEAETRRVTEFWEGLGANVEIMEPEHHDLVLAVTSHAPHLIAYTMVGVADDLGRVTNSEVVNFSAGGFRDFTRIAASDPTMWRDVFLSNKAATLEILGRFTEELFALQRAIRMGDGEMLFDYFTRTRDIRKGILEAGQDVDVPDFGRAPKGKIEE